MSANFRFCFFVLCIGLLFTVNHETFAQQTHRDSLYFALVQALTRSNSDVVLEQHIEQLEYYYQNPVRINSVDLGGLLAIPFIDFQTAVAILDFRKTNGPNITEAVLLDSSLFNQNVAPLCLPFIITGFEQEPIAPVHVVLPADFHSEIQYNYKENTPRNGGNYYLGDLRYSAGNIQVNKDNGLFGGIFFEKDPGELSYTDYFSFTLKTPPLGLVDELILGDYTVDFGVGLVFCGPRQHTKNRFIFSSLLSGPKGFEPHTGYGESNFFRGAAVEIALNDFTLSPFFSTRKYDALLYTDDESSIYRLSTSGMHRTDYETAREGLVNEQMQGAGLSFHPGNNIYVSALAALSKFDTIVKPQTTTENFIFGLHALYQHKNFTIISELSLANKKTGVFISAGLSSANGHSVLLSVRNYNSGFYNLQGKPFRQISIFGNGETGIGFAYNRRFGDRNMGLFADYYTAREAVIQSISYNSGVELGAYTSVDFTSRTNVIFSLRYKNSIRSGQSAYSPSGTYSVSSGKLEARFKLGRTITANQKVDININGYPYGSSSNMTMLLSTELIWRVIESLQLSGRIFLNAFNSTSFPLFENEYYNTGESYTYILTDAIGWHLRLHWKSARNLSIALQYVKRSRFNESNYDSESAQGGLSIRWAF
ncbi:MAG: hypothetical protein HYV28_13995 [Ignavibacteriales bacterium]|nr:hypothetical protein [Ignavibacteriales bacterium]